MPAALARASGHHGAAGGACIPVRGAVARHRHHRLSSRVFHTPVLEISESMYFVPVIAGAVDIALTEAIYLVRQMRGKLGAPGTGHAPVAWHPAS